MARHVILSYRRHRDLALDRFCDARTGPRRIRDVNDAFGTSVPGLGVRMVRSTSPGGLSNSDLGWNTMRPCQLPACGSRGVPILVDPFDTPFGLTFVFRDPDGYAIAIHGAVGGPDS
jgi:hypothetical protein